MWQTSNGPHCLGILAIADKLLNLGPTGSTMSHFLWHSRRLVKNKQNRRRPYKGFFTDVLACGLNSTYWKYLIIIWHSKLIALQPWRHLGGGKCLEGIRSYGKTRANFQASPKTWFCNSLQPFPNEEAVTSTLINLHFLGLTSKSFLVWKLSYAHGPEICF